MGTHHLVLGETTDFLTGQTVTDTHDERARQKIARFLIREKGYSKSDISARVRLDLEVDGRAGSMLVDFVLKSNDREFMIILFRPGSLVSRRRVAVAAARLIGDFVLPYAAVSNAEDAEIMETRSGKVIDRGLDGIFCGGEAESLLAGPETWALSAERREKEKRILFAMEILAQKECDDYTCSSL